MVNGVAQWCLYWRAILNRRRHKTRSFSNKKQNYPHQPAVPQWLIAVRFVLIVLGMWNGLYFMERIVGNAHVNNYKAKLELKKLK